MDNLSRSFDYVLVGAGLQNGLIAMALLDRKPSVQLALVEREPTIGGNHTWCFHEADVPASAMSFVAPLVECRWPGYRVAFPNHQRTLSAGYAAVTSARFAQVVAERLARSSSKLLLSSPATVVEKQRVVLADGRELRGQLVIDARGPDQASVDESYSGYQKFVGLEVRTDKPHGRTLPDLMDAQVEQLDGFRFVYCLPFSPDRLLIEDTRFSDSATLDVADLQTKIGDYAASRGIEIADVVRTESGVLPLPWKGDVDRSTGPLRAGFQGGWFHPVTGYSFPLAVRMAMYVASTPVAEVFGAGYDQLVADQRSQLKFCFRLNKMLFGWFPPHQRYNVLSRFYRLPEPVICRFYAMQLRTSDRARFFLGRPPRGMSYRAALFGRSPL